MPTSTSFDQITIGRLKAGSSDWSDDLPLGVIGLIPDSDVDVYNEAESKLAGLSTSRVRGRQFFSAIGVCMNNFMVAQRFADEPDLDTMVAGIPTLRTRPTRVKLRLLQAPAITRSYVLAQR